jgi:hypothetical protein
MYYSNKAYAVAGQMKSMAGLASVLFQIASTNYNMGNNKLAKKQVLRTLAICDSVRFKVQIPPAYNLLKKIQIKEGDYKGALGSLELHMQTKDSLNSANNQKKIYEAEANYNLEKKENENRLLQQTNEIQALQLGKNQYLLIGLGASLALLLIIGFLLIRQNKLRSERQSIQMQQKLLRSQMDPHFIFNALNSINQFILTEENEKAQSYLTRFSTLLRRLLESSTKEVISIREEVVILEKYLEIESMRFGNVFQYKLTVADNCKAAETDIPHFLVQPFVENAIWHGLLPKEGEKTVEVHFEQISPMLVKCTIDDNGVGRQEKPEQESTKHKLSLAIAFIKQRLEILGKMKKVSCGVEIVDKKDAEGKAAGTRVMVTIPVMQA